MRRTLARIAVTLACTAGLHAQVLPTPRRSGYGYGYGYGRYARPSTPRITFDQYQRAVRGQGVPMVPGVGGGLPVVPLLRQGGLGTGLSGPAGFNPFARRLPSLPAGQGGTKPGAGQQGQPDLSRWPTWLQLGGPGRRVQNAGPGAKADPKRGYLARLARNVEVRPAGETAFYPLAFWDGERILGPGGELRIRGQGRALLLFSDGTRLNLIDACHVRLVEAAPERLVIEVVSVTRADCRFGSRTVELELPDKSRARGSNLGLLLKRSSRDAPWASTGIEDRLTVSNWGPGQLRLQPSGDVAAGGKTSYDLEPNRRSLIALTGRSGSAGTGDAELPQDLPGGGVSLRASLDARLERVGESLQIESQGGAANVVWGSFTARVPAGRRLILDPLLGRPFSARRRSAPAKAGAADRKKSR